MSERLSQTIDIETPELVVVSYTVAGLGSRVYAALIDLAICALAFIVVIVAVLAMGSRSAAEQLDRPSPSTAWAVAVMIIMQFVVLLVVIGLLMPIQAFASPARYRNL